MMLEITAPNPELREPNLSTPDFNEAGADSTRPPEAAPPTGTLTRARVVPTLEHLLHAIALLLALGARLISLGASPLSPAEATNSWQAWLDAMALHVANAPQASSALLHALQTALFWVAGGGGDETLARLPVALLSALIALLPWFWRDRLGRTGAVILAFLLALDPWLIALGRSADSAALSATIGLIALTALHVANSPMRQRDTNDADAPVPANSFASALAAIALGLLLVSGAQAWSWLIVVLLYGLLGRSNRWRITITTRDWILFGAAALLGATGWLALPQELSMVSASLSERLARFGEADYALGWPWLRLLVDQPFLVLFGAIGIASVWRTRATNSEDLDTHMRLFLTLWLGWGALLMLLPGRTPAELPLFGVPLAVFAALGIAYLLQVARTIPHLEDWRDAALLGIVLIIVQFSLAFWLISLVWNQSWPTVEGTFVIGLLLVSLALIAGFAAFASGRQALLVALSIAGIFLLALNLSAAYSLASAPEPRHPNGFHAVTSHPDARMLAQDVEALSSRRVGDATELPVIVVNDATQKPDPQLGWALRHMRNLTFADTSKLGNSHQAARPPLVITSGAAASAVWNQNYIGTNYNVRTTWLPATLPPLTGYADKASFWAASGRPWMRWLLFREAPSAQPESVVLWAIP